MKGRDRRKLGDLLTGAGVISAAALEEALAEQRATGARLGEIIVASGALSEERLAAFLAAQLGVPLANLDEARPSGAVLGLLPEPVARRLLALPLGIEKEAALVAMADPLDLAAMDEVVARAGRPVRPLIAPAQALRRAIEEAYAFIGTGDAGPAAPVNGKPAAPVARLVDSLIRKAVRERASDIHLEPGEGGLRARFRVDGVMLPAPALERGMEAALVARLKIMARLDIAENRMPQEGAFTAEVDGRGVEARVSTFPTIHGEALVIRLQDRARALLGLEQTGLEGAPLAWFREALRRPSGLLVVTGPTGSGKTTTLYAALAELACPRRVTLTIEDPVEYRLAHTRQTQVNPKAGLTFAAGLRSILRQDPDVVMIGEIRDAEPAAMAARAALTGRLALSTMHTGDAAGAVERLLDLGVEAPLVAATLRGALSQRLARRLCPRCHPAATPAGGEALMAAERPARYRSGVCGLCRGGGFHGRIGVFGFFAPDEAAREMIARGARGGELRAAARDRGFGPPLLDDALAKARAGITTREEIERVTGGDG